MSGLALRRSRRLERLAKEKRRVDALPEGEAAHSSGRLGEPLSGCANQVGVLFRPSVVT